MATEERKGFSGLFDELDKARNAGMTAGNFWGGLFSGVIVEPIANRAARFKDYLREVGSVHNDNVEIPLNMKTCLGDNFASLYGDCDNNTDVSDKKNEIEDANGNKVAVLNTKGLCSYDTEMYSLFSCSWGTMDKLQLSETFQVAYEVSLLTKKYANKYCESFEFDANMENKFKDMARNTDEYKKAWADFSSKSENRANYNSDEEMKQGFDADYFKSSSADPWYKRVFSAESYNKLRDEYNNAVSDEYTQQLARYKEYCENNGLNWNGVMQRVSEEMQAECYNYGKASQHLFSGGIPKVITGANQYVTANNENIAQRGFLMMAGAMKAEGQDVNYTYYGRQYGEDKFSDIKNSSFGSKLLDRIVETWKTVCEKIKNSRILHPIDKVLKPAAKGLDNMMDRFEEKGAVKDSDEILL